MYDTVKLFKKGKEGKDFLLSEDIKLKKGQNFNIDAGKNCRIGVKYKQNGVEDIIFIKFSAPKLLYGTNVQELKKEDLMNVVPNLSLALSSFVDISLEEMSVSGIDLCKNLDFGNDITQYLEPLCKELKYMTNEFNSIYYPDESFTLYNGFRSICFYDKFKESNNKKIYCPQNILRIEYSLKRAESIRRFYDLDENIKLSEVLTTILYDETKGRLLEYFDDILKIDINVPLVSIDDGALMNLVQNEFKDGCIWKFLALKYVKDKGLNKKYIRSLVKNISPANVSNQMSTIHKLANKVGSPKNNVIQSLKRVLIENLSINDNSSTLL